MILSVYFLGAKAILSIFPVLLLKLLFHIVSRAYTSQSNSAFVLYSGHPERISAQSSPLQLIS